MSLDSHMTSGASGDLRWEIRAVAAVTQSW